MSDIDQVNLIKTEKLLKTINPSVISVQADVSSLEDSSRLFETSLKTFNQIDILINNVGINASGGILNLDFNQAKKVFKPNLIGPFYLTHLAAKQMVEEKIPGSILFTSSTHARVTMLSPTYTATKAAIENIVRDIALELAEYKIRVNAVAPGIVAIRGEKKLENKLVPLGETSVPEDIANTMIFLLSDKARHVTGQTITVDGGFSLIHTHYLQNKSLLDFY